jgi:hypothetical protein
VAEDAGYRSNRLDLLPKPVERAPTQFAGRVIAEPGEFTANPVPLA